MEPEDGTVGFVDGSVVGGTGRASGMLGVGEGVVDGGTDGTCGFSVAGTEGMEGELGTEGISGEGSVTGVAPPVVGGTPGRPGNSLPSHANFATHLPL